MNKNNRNLEIDKNKNLIEKKVYVEKIIEDLKDNYDFEWWLFYEWYYIDKSWNVYEVYYKKNWKVYFIWDIDNPILLIQLADLLINKKEKEMFILKKVNKNSDEYYKFLKNFENIIFYTKRSFFELCSKNEVKQIENIYFVLERFYKQWWLTFPDILKIYIYWWIDKESFLYFLDKILEKKYLINQLRDKRFYRLFQSLVADRKKAVVFINNCHNIEQCLNTSRNSYTRYNLYVRLIVVNNLYKKWIIPEDKYEVYKKNIESIIKILEEMKKLDKEKKKEKQKQIKEIKKRIDEFLMEL